MLSQCRASQTQTPVSLKRSPPRPRAVRIFAPNINGNFTCLFSCSRHQQKTKGSSSIPCFHGVGLASSPHRNNVSYEGRRQPRQRRDVTDAGHAPRRGNGGHYGATVQTRLPPKRRTENVRRNNFGPNSGISMDDTSTQSVQVGLHSSNTMCIVHYTSIRCILMARTCMQRNIELN